jgi:hypothetical protein
MLWFLLLLLLIAWILGLAGTYQAASLVLWLLLVGALLVLAVQLMWGRNKSG